MSHMLMVIRYVLSKESVGHIELALTSKQKAEISDGHHQAIIPKKLDRKEKKAEDIQTIFLEWHNVRFSYLDGTEEIRRGCWCNICW